MLSKDPWSKGTVGRSSGFGRHDQSLVKVVLILVDDPRDLHLPQARLERVGLEDLVSDCIQVEGDTPIKFRG
jgi:hypothetical protein